jgi:hypothetical protein
MVNTHLTLVTPSILKRTVTPKRLPNADLRTREHLTEVEVERLMNAARKNRWAHRDATMLLVAYRHGLRPAELVDLRWDQVASSRPVRCTSAGSSGGRPVPIQFLATSYAPCGGSSANKTPSRHSCSPRNEGHHSPRQASPAWWNA